MKITSRDDVAARGLLLVIAIVDKSLDKAARAMLASICHALL